MTCEFYALGKEKYFISSLSFHSKSYKLLLYVYNCIHVCFACQFELEKYNMFKPNGVHVF